MTTIMTFFLISDYQPATIWPCISANIYT